MTMLPLEIIPAGAGSGKTHAIQEKLARLVEDRLIAPEKIAAVTFTEAAAAELRERIRSGLVRKGRLADALRLDRAYISTIHGFGLRIITEFALDAGISPRPRLLNEDERDTLVRLALARSDKAGYIRANLRKLGYADVYDTSPEDLFRERILHLIDKLRGIGREQHDGDLIPHAAALLEKLYGPAQHAEHLKEVLLTAVANLLRCFPDNLAPGILDNKSATEALDGDYRALQRAMAGQALDTDWKLWQRLRSLRVKVQKNRLPDGYAELAEAVMAAAHALPSHPGPLAEALIHVSQLIEAAQDCLTGYGEDKTERGLVDYADMLGLCHRLLTSGPGLLDTLRSRIDCLVVDEFQDTNPLQFSLLWTLARAGVPTLVVGDVKQAIMGFQGADSRLLQALQGRYPDAVRPLTNNWRSTPAVMAWVNSVGAALFGSGYQDLSVRDEARYPSSLSPLEAVEFPDGTRRGSTLIIAQHTAARIKALLDDPAQEVYDKALKRQRRLRGGDIAVVCPVNKRLKHYADSLGRLGIAVRLEQEGWFESRIIQLAWHALCFVADPGDRHAELYLAVTELGSLSLGEALGRMLDHGPLAEPLIDLLRGTAEGAAERPVQQLVADTVAALDLFGRVAEWPDAEQARANLLRLLGEAGEFLAVNRDALSCSGIHGTGLKQFLAWLRSRAERENGQPDPAPLDENSVRLMTWHKAKGLEWPVVAVCGTDCDALPRLPAVEVAHLDDFSHLDAILPSARIAILPDFTAPETRQAVMAHLWDDTVGNARRLLYVALTRAREKVILECPTHLDAKEDRRKVTYWDILRDAARLELVANRMCVNGAEFPCRIVKADRDAPAEFDGDEQQADRPLPVIGRRALVPASLPAGLTPESCAPSALHGRETILPGILRDFVYGEPLGVRFSGLAANERGLLLHRCFEVLCCHSERKPLLAAATGYPLEDVQTEAICRAVAAFDRWLAHTLQPVTLSAEVPFLAVDGAGTVVSGSIDLLVETADGFWIVDHKSDGVEDCPARFAFYYPQLRCYADAVTQARNDKPVRGIVINWVSVGVVSVLEVNSLQFDR